MDVISRTARHARRVMRSIGIRKTREVYKQYMLEDHDLMRFIEDRYNNNTQKGGGKIRKIHYVFENYDFVMYERKIEDGYDISVRRNDDIEDAQTCLHIMCNSKLGLAYLQNISYYKDCVKVGLQYPGGGSVLLKMFLDFMRTNKDRYKIKRIQLKDNSMYPCKNSKIKFAIMHTLMFGNTWYGKYGFRPYDPYENKPDEYGREKYNLNKLITKTTMVKNTKLFDLLKDALKKAKPDYTDNKIKTFVDTFRQNYGSYSVNRFAQEFLAKYDMTCDVFYLFYERFADNIGLTNFFDRSFYLDL